jgi:hypothetical protein
LSLPTCIEVQLDARDLHIFEILVEFKEFKFCWAWSKIYRVKIESLSLVDACFLRLKILRFISMVRYSGLGKKRIWSSNSFSFIILSAVISLSNPTEVFAYSAGGGNDGGNASATAIGSGNNATPPNASAYGNNANASGQNSISVGSNSSASQSNGTALGYNTRAIGSSSVALGDSVAANASNSVSIGPSSSTATSASNSVAIEQGGNPVQKTLWL